MVQLLADGDPVYLVTCGDGKDAEIMGIYSSEQKVSEAIEFDMDTMELPRDSYHVITMRLNQ